MIKWFELVKQLEQHTVFNIGKVAALTGKGRHYAAVLIERLVKKGYLSQLGRDIYTTKKDPFVIASRIHWPSYISMWGAIRYYNLTEQLPHSIEVVTPVRSRKKVIKFMNTEIIFTQAKPKYFFGFKKIRYGEDIVFIAEKEKAFIDAALFRKMSFSEIYEMIRDNKKEINFSKLISYAIQTQNNALIKRFGYLAEKLGYDFYKRLKKHIRSTYCSLDYSVPLKGKKNEKWHIIENAVIE